MAPSSCRSPTLFAFYCGGIVSPVSPCSTTRGREVQPLAALYPTVRLSPYRVFPPTHPFVLTGTFVQFFDYFLCSLYISNHIKIFISLRIPKDSIN